MKQFFTLLLVCSLLPLCLHAQKKKKSSKTPVKPTVTTVVEKPKPEEVMGFPELKVQIGHTKNLVNYEFNRDGSLLLTLGEENLIKLWDVRSGRELQTIKLDTLHKLHVRFSQDEKRILVVTGLKNTTIRVVDLAKGTLIREVPVATTYAPQAALISGDRLLYYPTNPGEYHTIKMMNITNGTNIATFTHGSVPDDGIERFEVSGTGKYLLTYNNEIAKVWDISTKTAIAEVKSYSTYDRSFPRITSDEKGLIVKTYSQPARYYDLVAKKFLYTYGEDAHISDNGLLYSTSRKDDSKKFNLIRASDSTTLLSIQQVGYFAPEVQFSPDGAFAFYQIDFDSIGVIDLKAQKILYYVDESYRSTFSPSGMIFQRNPSWKSGSAYMRTIEPSSGRVLAEFKGYLGNVNFSAFSPDGQYAVWLHDSTEVEVWEFREGPTFKKFTAHTDDVTTLAFHPNGKWLATAGLDKNVCLWDIEKSSLIWKQSVYTTWAGALRFSQDGKYLAALLEESSFKIWDVNTVKAFKKYKSHTARVTALAFSLDGKKVISGSWDKTVKIWDVASSTVLKTLTGSEHPVNSVNISADGSWIVAGGGDMRYATAFYNGNNKINIWNSADGTKIKTLNGPENGTIIEIAFSPDKRFVLTRTDVNNAALGWAIIDINSDYSCVYEVWSVADDRLVLSFDGNFKFIDKLFTADNGIYYSDANNNMRLFDLNSLAPRSTFTLSGHSGHIQYFMPSGNGYAISRSNEDGLMKFWNLSTGKEVLTYVLLGGPNEDYLIFNTQNYYMGSKNGVKAVHFKRGYQVYSFEQFDLPFNRPDIIMSALPQTDPELIQSFKRAYQKRLQKTGFTEDMFNSDFHMPVCSINKTALKLTTTDRAYTIQVNASDSKYKLKRLNIWVNDVPVYGSNGTEIAGAVSTYNKSISLSLSNGLNRIRVSVMNEKGVESLVDGYEVEFRGTAIQPDLYLVLIGVSQFKDSHMNLNYPAKDVADVEVLYKSHRGQYRNINTFKLVNNYATKANILALKEKLKLARPDDHVIIFVASHGLLDANLDYFLATYDTDFRNPSALGLSYDALESMLDGIAPRQKVLLMDACHSGEVDKDEVQLIQTGSDTTKSNEDIQFRAQEGVTVKNIYGENSFELMKNLFADLRKGSGATVISAAGGGEFAMESNIWNNGVFTFSLLEALRDAKADQNKDKTITLSELQQYLQVRVPELTKGKQKPTSRAENLNYDYILWK